MSENRQLAQKRQCDQSRQVWNKFKWCCTVTGNILLSVFGLNPRITDGGSNPDMPLNWFNTTAFRPPLNMKETLLVVNIFHKIYPPSLPEVYWSGFNIWLTIFLFPLCILRKTSNAKHGFGYSSLYLINRQLAILIKCWLRFFWCTT